MTVELAIRALQDVRESAGRDVTAAACNPDQTPAAIVALLKYVRALEAEVARLADRIDQVQHAAAVAQRTADAAHGVGLDG